MLLKNIISIAAIIAGIASLIYLNVGHTSNLQYFSNIKHNVILIAVLMDGTPIIKNGLTKNECNRRVIILRVNNPVKSIKCKVVAK